MVSDDDYNSLLKRIEKLEALGLTEAELKVIPSHGNTKHDPLQNLFNGAPIMVRCDASSAWNDYILEERYENKFIVRTSTGWFKNTHEFYNLCRLPTIEESPRNTWLAHSGTSICPEGVEGLDILIWLGNNTILRTSGKPLMGNRSWTEVERFMILEY